LCLIFTGSVLYAEDYREESSLNYTYLGPVFSLSKNSAQYSDWVENEYAAQKISGNSFAGGLLFKLIANDFSGDFQWKYSYGKYSDTLTCLEFDISGSYLLTLSKDIYTGIGFGFYLETPPSNQVHNGAAGIYIPLTFVYATTNDTRLVIDLFGKYGSFAIGNDTSFLSFGCNIGFVFKVGRI